MISCYRFLGLLVFSTLAGILFLNYEYYGYDATTVAIENHVDFFDEVQIDSNYSHIVKNHFIEEARIDRLYSRFLIIPEHKLLFCFIEKVGCTYFNELFKSLRSRYDPSLKTGGIWNRNNMKAHNMTEDDIKMLVIDPAWHKAVFYREPMERFLSAYRSKCEPNHDSDRHHCTTAFGSENASFSVAVHRLEEEPSVRDVHWVPQSDFCGGLRTQLSYYQTIERLEPETSHDKVGKLLREVGVDPGTVRAYKKSTSTPKHDTKSKHEHETHASEAMLKYFTTPELACIVIKYYLEDYLVFGIPIPEWLAHWNFHGNQWLTGNCSSLNH